MGPEGEREHLFAGEFSVGQVTSLQAAIGKGRMEMEGHGIVDAGANASAGEVPAQTGAFADADDVEVVDRARWTRD